MSPLITDYEAWLWCEICDHIILTEAYDFDLDMCAACAEVTNK